MCWKVSISYNSEFRTKTSQSFFASLAYVMEVVSQNGVKALKRAYIERL